ncbi:putative mitochondrial HSP70-like protein [Leptomonas pyrrhocoris]|uniref:Putative mitochondrial HSP70-like protein n=1 Tax=Leptomonas pyrrhocoris TaxID=157538 RepID=A0A0N0VCT7_LEPPY|nr:putative mitochondrial HSP70-like protein [Leptomonas pyrrhocoris]XP_015652191.1 putative mitochondrial HSP70-like protein [Leptomonas pyrrhocoris]KPA73751.1 putative mitochondrial HSP70-like protein [Leptomonas pyrrhocoris]KPA73752.1 putative mitochondrial HSP70-like protein [Leptomonas pyrrhocoris]|eukprot:XP_015652190.1 putative mitochondrial HSP70-like protein [Leptomonas pyrrhocoris]
MKPVTARASGCAGARHRCLRVLCALLLLFAAVPPRDSGGRNGRQSFLFVDVAVAAGAAGALPSSPPIIEAELIAIDLGHENMKISAWRVQEEEVQVVKPGGTGTAVTTTTATTGVVSMVLNDQTNRKSPPCVAFRYFKASAGSAANDGSNIITNAEEAKADAAVEGNLLYPADYQLERTFAEQAQALAPRFPTQVICDPAQLLGYTLFNATSTANGSEPAAAASPYQISADELTATYSFHVKPISQQQQQWRQRRQALGVFVPFFSSPNNPIDSADAGSFFSAEELTAMLFGYARRMAEKADAADNALSEDEERQLIDLLNNTAARGDRDSAPLRGHAVPRYAALTVPIHSTVAQRQALVDAAALVGLRVVRLVHSTTGAAVQLAYMKAEQVFVPGTTQYVMLYDMGSQQAEVAVYSYAAVPSAVAQRVKYAGAIELKALVGSRQLGGAAFDTCIAAQWDALYFANSILAGVGRARTEAERRAAAKQRGSLLRAAHKAKEMLSVNQEAHITLDGVHADPARFSEAARTQLQRQPRVAAVTPDGVLTLRYTRRAFEQECAALFDAAVALRDEAIAATAGLVGTVGALARFEVIGGGTRVPLLLQRLSEGYRDGGSLVDRTLNSDEAAVLGTTLLSIATAPHALQLRGASSVPRYRVREWLTSAVYVSISSHNVKAKKTDGTDDEDGQPGRAPKAVTSSTAGDDTAHLRLLFPAVKTIVPTTRSVRVQLATDGADSAEDNGANRTSDQQHGDVVHHKQKMTSSAPAVGDSVTVTLYSGLAVDEAYREGVRAASAQVPDSHGGNNSTSVDPADRVVAVPAAAGCPSCYVRTYVVDGITDAKEVLKAQVERQHSAGRGHGGGGGVIVELDSAEVVVEAAATVSGIPHCTVAYLRAVYRVTPVNSTAATLPTAEGMHSSRPEGVEAGTSEAAHQGETHEGGGAAAAEETSVDEEEEQAGAHAEPATTTAAAAATTTSDVFEVKVSALPIRRVTPSRDDVSTTATTTAVMLSLRCRCATTWTARSCCAHTDGCSGCSGWTTFACNAVRCATTSKVRLSG